MKTNKLFQAGMIFTMLAGLAGCATHYGSRPIQMTITTSVGTRMTNGVPIYLVDNAEWVGSGMSTIDRSACLKYLNKLQADVRHQPETGFKMGRSPYVVALMPRAVIIIADAGNQLVQCDQGIVVPGKVMQLGNGQEKMLDTVNINLQ